MKNSKFILVLALLFCGLIFKAQKKSAPKKEEGLVWHTDLLKANEVSQKTKKPIFAMFTGSDWCGWCIKLQNDVFAKKEFIDWAKKNVVLMEVDFPRMKQLSPEMQQQNAGLQQTFNVAGYPTVWMFNMVKDEKTGKFNIFPLGSVGYPQGAQPGKEEVKFINDANSFLKKDNKK